jgi:hypothetical protein
MVRALGDLINTLTIFVPLRVLVLVGVGLAITAAPYWMEAMKDRQLRGMVRRCVRAENVDRNELVDDILRRAGDKPNRLLTVVHSAAHYAQRDVHDRALAALEATGKAAADVKRLRREAEKPAVQVRDPLVATIRIEKLLDAGLTVAAREQLDAALRAFPGDPDLEALRARAYAEPAGAPTEST